ncbi:MAG: hypothetical protein ACP6IY_09065 [Promethearchaeia archaeon]
MEDRLKNLILNNKYFHSLLKKYTFLYREFSSIEDYCELKWNKKKQDWEILGYYCHNINKPLPSKKKNIFYISLSIPEYNWGTLFSEMERRFNDYLCKTMGEEEIDEMIEKDYDRYMQLRDEYFRNNKIKIVNDWFKLTEDNVYEYINRELLKLREAYLIKKQFT